MVHDFDFNQQLGMSEGRSNGKDSKNIFYHVFANTIRIEKSELYDDMKGVDYWLSQKAGNRIGVDVKRRKVDYFALKGEDDIALETYSDVEKKKIGWTLDKRKMTDYVLWIWEDTGRYLVLPFPPLCTVFTSHVEEWKKSYKPIKQRSNEGQWYSECMFVSRLVVRRAINEVSGLSTKPRTAFVVPPRVSGNETPRAIRQELEIKTYSGIERLIQQSRTPSAIERTQAVISRSRIPQNHPEYPIIIALLNAQERKINIQGQSA